MSAVQPEHFNRIRNPSESQAILTIDIFEIKVLLVSLDWDDWACQSTAEIVQEDVSDGLISYAINESTQTSGEDENAHIQNILDAHKHYPCYNSR